ncbi:unnamed protein product [Urochloa decumbens]|uniref:F-box domain-containing protein n=1 Tax=Urochloa decumbens TaxID=240449 RepID=A0ABC8WBG9_9POAL
MASSSFSSVPPPPAAIGWAALPRDVLWSLFTDLGQREVLSGAGLACAPWRHLVRDEPALWRRIDLTAAAGDTVPGCWKAMALAAIDRSASQCEAFWGRADDEVLLYLADRAQGRGPSTNTCVIAIEEAAEGRHASQIFICNAWPPARPSLLCGSGLQNCRAGPGRASYMKSLRITSSYDVSSKVFAELIKKFPLLEELQLVLKSDAYTTNSKEPHTNSWVELFQSACQACRNLHHFTVQLADKDMSYDSYSYYGSKDRSARRFSIPMMHGLHSLELFGGHLTMDVMMEIVDNCPSLESLHISGMPYLYGREEKELRDKCSKIKDLRLPDMDYDDYVS